MGYSNDGLCHVLDKDSNTTFIIPENCCVRLLDEIYDSPPYFEQGCDVHAVYPQTDTLYLGTIIDNTVHNNVIAVVFQDYEDGKAETRYVPVVDIVLSQCLAITSIRCGVCCGIMFQVNDKNPLINTFPCIKCKK